MKKRVFVGPLLAAPLPKLSAQRPSMAIGGPSADGIPKDVCAFPAAVATRDLTTSRSPAETNGDFLPGDLIGVEITVSDIRAANPPCTAPDTVIGSGPSNGNFNIAVPPLAVNQCVYVFDTCTMLISDVACARPPAPAPAMSPQMTVVAMLVLALVALVSLLRLKRDI